MMNRDLYRRISRPCMIVLAVVLTAAVSFTAIADSWSRYDLFLGGYVINTNDVPLVDGDKCLLPAKQVAAFVGGTVTADSSSATIKWGGYRVTVRDGQRDAGYTSYFNTQETSFRAKAPAKFTSSEIYCSADVFTDLMKAAKLTVNTGFSQVRVEALSAPTATPVPSAKPTATPTPTPAPTATPTPTPTPAPTATPEVTPTPTPTPKPTAKPISDDGVYKAKQLVAGLIYDNTGTRRYFNVTGVSLTNGYDPISSRNYTESVSSDGRTYSISFPDSGKFANATYNIYDQMFNTLKVERVNGNLVKFTFCANQPVVALATSRKNFGTSYSAISFYPKKTSAFRVMIDAGHGGEDPGAVSGSTYESNLNLAIAREVISGLRAKGIDVVATRENDTYVGIYERAYLANAAGANLFVSIHNNSTTSSITRGTGTYYYNGSTNGSRAALNIQKRLVASLGTVDHGIIANTELVVLKATDMPACLAEVGFMSNATELANLNNAAFRSKAAAAIVNGIVETIGQMGQ